jgi:uncharacterized PurR-regulated membrane protein YhhQ (DUF165 family)
MSKTVAIAAATASIVIGVAIYYLVSSRKKKKVHIQKIFLLTECTIGSEICFIGSSNLNICCFRVIRNLGNVKCSLRVHGVILYKLIITSRASDQSGEF